VTDNSKLIGLQTWNNVLKIQIHLMG